MSKSASKLMAHSQWETGVWQPYRLLFKPTSGRHCSVYGPVKGKLHLDTPSRGPYPERTFTFFTALMNLTAAPLPVRLPCLGLEAP